jgi:hypothetical protein
MSLEAKVVDYIVSCPPSCLRSGSAACGTPYRVVPEITYLTAASSKRLGITDRRHLRSQPSSVFMAAAGS